MDATAAVVVPWMKSNRSVGRIAIHQEARESRISCITNDDAKMSFYRLKKGKSRQALA
jgi:hypothetical protein